jgi:diadenosine tetraphosphate (Ap4A) HIT family hydrolase
MDGCEVCQIQARSEAGDDPWAVARLQSGYVQLYRIQYYRGYTFFSARRCVRELHLLGAAERSLFLHEMAEVAHAVFRAFAPVKLNYDMLGNGVPHLHWHRAPPCRRPSPFAPIWENLDFLRSRDGHEETDTELRGELRACS